MPQWRKKIINPLSLERRFILKIFKKEFDYSMWIVIGSVILLSIIGLINMRNADFYSNSSYHHSQVLWLILGFIFASIVASVDLKIFFELSHIFYWIIIFLLILVLFIGKEVHGARRWISFFGFNFQPSELTKVTTILLTARFFHKEKKGESASLMRLLKPFGYIFLPASLIIMEPDLGTAALIILINFSIIVFEGINIRSFAMLIGVFFLIFPVSWKTGIIQDYQKDRILMWINPEKYEWSVEKEKKIDRSMQPEQSLWAVGSGKIFGKGGKLGAQSRLKFLPEMHTDFILATFAEERGLAGCILLLFLYFLLIISCLKIAVSSQEKFGVLVGVGVSFMIFWKFLTNTAMVIGLFPVVGVTLPFLSYGGSSIIAVMIGIGFIINIAMGKGKV